MADAVIAHGLKKQFTSGQGRVEAVRGVDLTVARGEVLGFLGPNGAGKTTTMRMLTTLLPIDSGEAQVAGLDVRRQPGEVRRHIGYVGQLGGADGLATGRENLVLQAQLYGASYREASARADEVIDALDLKGFADRKVATYSGGQRRRLEIGLGIMHRPDVLFLDEPTTGLDPQNRVSLWEQIRRFRDAGTAIFLTTHYLEEADALADRLSVMDHGRIVATGTPRELKQQVAGDVVTIGLKPDRRGSEDLLQLLRQEPFVREATGSEGRVQLFVEQGEAVLPAVIRLLDQAGIEMQSISLAAPTLDDVFLKLTGRSLRDGGRGPTEGDAA